MKQGIIYGGAFVFAFVIVTGLLIYLNSSYENIFEFNFNPRQDVQLKDSTTTEAIKPPVNETFNDSSEVKDSVLFSSLGEIETQDSAKVELKTEAKDVIQESVKENKTKSNEQLISNNQSPVQPNEDAQINKDLANNNEYKDWVEKVTSIYSAMEPKKAAKIIQTYSDNVARDILYNMSKKTAAKVVSEFSPETANRIFRFE